MAGGSLGISGSKNKNVQESTLSTQQSGGQTSTNTQRLDPFSQAHVSRMRSQGANAANMVQNAPGSFIAGPTDAFRTGMGTMERIAGLDPEHQAMQIGATSVGRPGSVRARDRAANFDFNPEQFNNARTQDFFNPFEENVVAGLQSDFDRQRQQAMNAANQQATAAGAFGGSRGEVLAAQALGDVNQQEAQQLAQVRAGGFGQAQQAALGEWEQMQNLGLGAAQSRTDAQLAGAGQHLQAGLANQNARLQAMGMNQQAHLQAGMANQQAGLSAQGLDLQGLGLALQGGGQLSQAGELQRQIQQQALQEDIMRAQLGQDFLGNALGPVGMDTASQQAFNQQGFQEGWQKGTGQQFGATAEGGLGFGGD